MAGKQSNLSNQVVGLQRLVTKTVRQAKAILTMAAALGIDAPKRKYRKRKKGAAKPGPKPGKKAKKGSKKGNTHLTRAKEKTRDSED